MNLVTTDCSVTISDYFMLELHFVKNVGFKYCFAFDESYVITKKTKMNKWFAL